MPSIADKPVKQALKEVPLLADLSDGELQWLTDHLEDCHYRAGDVLTHQGDPAEYMIIILDGEIQARSEGGNPNLPPYIASTGTITGLLPQSRMTTFARTTTAVLPTRMLRMHKRHFEEMVKAIPQLSPRLLGVMADRIRDTTKMDIQYEKLAALGKLSAGLAHELNNPAAAARSAAGEIRRLLDRLRSADLSLKDNLVAPEAWRIISGLEQEAIKNASACTPLDSLTRSDREEQFAAALTAAGIADAWELAPELADAGLNGQLITQLSDSVGPKTAQCVLTRLASLVGLYKISTDIQESTTRVSELVRAIKEYSWMDTQPEREIDIHQGLENTLTILKHQLRSGIGVERDYDPDLPRICAHGGELNQIWTNLLQNAIDAMKGSSGEKLLRIRTAAQSGGVLVEITDTGPGIPPEIQDRIFEPFFTTKQQNDGTGLGLDLVGRIIRKHHGDIRFESRPGRTCFQVRLPLRRLGYSDAPDLGS